jgi:prepilin-type N-terminal cleavage/methylation domain-containing protein
MWAIKFRTIMLKKQRGFTAIELMFALGVIALGTVALVLVSKNNTNKQNSNIMVADVSSMIQNIQSAFASNADGFTNLSNTTAISMNLVPNDLIISGETIKSKFQNGTVVIAAGGNNDNFTITYNNVPAAVCNSAVTTLGGSAFSDITINGTSVYNTTEQKQLDATAVGTACHANKDQETIVFTAS